MGRHLTACIIFSCMLTAPAVAQPDFAAAFDRLDRNADGLISLDEIRWEGVQAEKYLEPVGTYVTDDGVGVELWRSPFGGREVSTPVENLGVRAANRLRTFPRDRGPVLVPVLTLAANSPFNTMTTERFESELRHAAEQRMKQDLNGDGGVSESELRSLLATAQNRSDRLQPNVATSPGKQALRTEKLQLTLDVYREYDLDADGKVTEDELLESWLSNLIGAYALPKN